MRRPAMAVTPPARAGWTLRLRAPWYSAAAKANARRRGVQSTIRPERDLAPTLRTAGLERNVEENLAALHTLVVTDDALVLGAVRLRLLACGDDTVTGDEHVEGDGGQYGKSELSAHSASFPHPPLYPPTIE